MILLVIALSVSFIGFDLLIVGIAILIANPKRSAYKESADGTVEGYGFVQNDKASYPYCKVEYEVEGHTYTCNFYKEELKGMTDTDLMEQYPLGSRLEVRYHAKKPEKAYCGELKHIGINLGLILGGIGLILLMTGGMLLVIAVLGTR